MYEKKSLSERRKKKVHWCNWCRIFFVCSKKRTIDNRSRDGGVSCHRFLNENSSEQWNVHSSCRVTAIKSHSLLTCSLTSFKGWKIDNLEKLELRMHEIIQWLAWQEIARCYVWSRESFLQVIIFLLDLFVMQFNLFNSNFLFFFAFFIGSLKLVFILLTVLGILIPIASIIYCFWTTRRSASTLEQIQRRLADNENNLLNQSLPDLEALVSRIR